MTEPLHEHGASGDRPELVAFEEDIATLYERAPCGVVSTIPDGTIATMNETFLTLTGYTRDEVVRHRTFAELLTVGGRIYYETHLAPMLFTAGRASEIALELVTADGGRLPVLVNAVLERDSSGQPLVIRMAIFVATERRTYERELVQARARAEQSEERARLLVRSLQQTLIPPAVPVVDGLEVAATYRPAGDGSEVGGDFYDFFEIGPDDWIVVVGDVTGKGVDAAMVTALARNTVRAAAVRTPGPAQLADTLNAVLRRDETVPLCTIAIARLRRPSGTWHVTTAHAGHPMILLLRAGEPVAELGRAGTILGAIDRPQFPLATSSLGEGDAIVLYTDGVTEGRHHQREVFGEQRARKSLEHHRGSANGLTYGLLDDVLQFQSGDTSDDIVIVSLQVARTPG